jgi:hypothetical protein
MPLSFKYLIPHWLRNSVTGKGILHPVRFGRQHMFYDELIFLQVLQLLCEHFLRDAWHLFPQITEAALVKAMEMTKDQYFPFPVDEGKRYIYRAGECFFM